jgi:glycosyltransferase involved in cell wall biosynthesis
MVVGSAIFGGALEFENHLRQLTIDLGLSQKVIFTGHRDDVHRVLSALDLLVHCSHAEPFGRVLIEAMAAGRPVVAFADGGVPEIVVHGTTGLLVPPGDEQALAEAMIELLADRDRSLRLGDEGRRRVELHFTAQQTARAIEAIYKPLVPGD